MADEILPNLYRIEIPLPRNPLKALNSYLIKADGRSLLIDTGWNQEECMTAMSSNLESLGVDLTKTDFFITHLHADHIGLVTSLAADTSKVYFNQKEALVVNMEKSAKEERWQKVMSIYLANGFPEEALEKSIASHPGRRYSVKHHLDFCVLKEGDTIEIGDYSFRCIETPGHSPGHMSLYEAKKKIFIAGDLILFDITPNINFWLEMPNPLKTYLASLEKVYDLDVNLVLPGHRSIVNNHRKRIRELQEHHQARVNEIIAALKDGGKTAFETAPCVTWDVTFGSWELFPPTQKWFAFGETLSHLKYLEGEGLVREETKGNKTLFSLV